MTDQVLEDAQLLVESKNTGFRDLRAKGIGFTVTGPDINIPIM
jgi:hypothetical protein